MIISANSPSRGSGMPNQVDGALVHAMSGSELSRVRTELYQLRIVPTLAPHPVQPHGHLAAQSHLGDALFPTHGQMPVALPPLLVTPCRGLRRFHQQKTQ